MFSSNLGDRSLRNMQYDDDGPYSFRPALSPRQEHPNNNYEQRKANAYSCAEA
jgi:hypothetical protein